MNRTLIDRYEIIREGQGIVAKATTLSLALRKTVDLADDEIGGRLARSLWIYDRLVNKHIFLDDLKHNTWLEGRPAAEP